MDGYGALASMGGIFTTVEDLARWVAGFLDAVPPRDDPDDGAPALARDAARDAAADGPRPGIAARATPSADAMRRRRGPALRLRAVPDRRRPVRPDRRPRRRLPGLRLAHALAPGIRARGRSRSRTTATAPAAPLARDLLVELLARRCRAGPADPPERRDARGARGGRAPDRGAGTTTLAAATFAMNVELDEPLADRRAAIERLRERHGSAPARRRTSPTESLTSVPPGVVARRRARPRSGRDPALAGAAAPGPDLRAHLRAGAAARSCSGPRSGSSRRSTRRRPAP